MYQNQWRHCHKCEGLFFGRSDAAAGICPADRGTHDMSGSGNYFLLRDETVYPFQSGWRHCRKCEGLFFAHADRRGVCTAGGTHEMEGSGNYALMMNAAEFPGQHSWRHCPKCEGLFFAPDGRLGRCPAGDSHVVGGTDYCLFLDREPPAGFEMYDGRARVRLCPANEWTSLLSTFVPEENVTFRGPPHAEVRVRIFFVSTQNHVLDGVNLVTLTTRVGDIEVRPKEKSYVAYSLRPAGGTIPFPPIRF